jgi:cytochrome c553
VSVRRSIHHLFVLGAVAAAMVMNAAELSPLELRGREIYTKGRGDDAEIIALLGEGQTSINASVVPCASCHGADGKGRAMALKVAGNDHRTQTA